MMRLLPVFLFVVSVLALRPASGQAASLAAWAPADVEAFVAVDMQNRTTALRGLNIGAFVGGYLQPARTPFAAAQPFDTYFPLDLLDVESASFTQLVQPWLGDELAVAYRPLGLMAGAPQAALLILPARDSFAAANTLADVVQGQDLLQTETIIGGTLYVGDRAAIALTASVVLIGDVELVRDALDVRAGGRSALAEDDEFVAVTAALPPAPDVLLFARDAAAANALPALVSLRGEAALLLAAYGQVVGDMLAAGALLSGQSSAIGAALDLSATLTNQVRAEVVYSTPTTAPTNPHAFDAGLLDYLPRSAMLAFTADDAGELADAALAALPFAASGPALLSALPLRGPLPAGVVPVPDPADAEYVVAALLDTLEAAGIEWPALRAGLTGSALVALLPRPNNPLPLPNLQADVLVALGTEDPAALADGVNALLDLYGMATAAETAEDGATRYRVPSGSADDPLLQFGAAGDVFLLGTGAAFEQALRAFYGDNRLVDQSRWAEVGAPAPGLYLDIDRLYNVYLPVAGGSSPGPVNRVSLTGAPLGDGLYGLSMRAVITLGG